MCDTGLRWRGFVRVREVGSWCRLGGLVYMSGVTEQVLNPEAKGSTRA
jgi:hypothetical protein